MFQYKVKTIVKGAAAQPHEELRTWKMVFLTYGKEHNVNIYLLTNAELFTVGKRKFKWK